MSIGFLVASIFISPYFARAANSTYRLATGGWQQVKQAAGTEKHKEHQV
jgi:hypothetical protein